MRRGSTAMESGNGGIERISVQGWIGEHGRDAPGPHRDLPHEPIKHLSHSLSHPPLLPSGHIHGRQRSLLQDQANDQAQQAEERVRRTSGQASDVYPVSSLLVLIRLLAAHHVFAGAGSSMTAVGSRMRIRPSRWSWRTEMRSRCSLNVRLEPPLVSLFPAYSSGVSGRGRRCAVRECGVKRCTMMERGCMTMQCHLSELARGWSGLHSSGRAMASGGGIGRPLLTGGVIGPMTSSSNGKRGFSWKH